mmetsp:Transcript_36646/g.60328  ORF Transcript_36646/g.60328 Transcript_36646/m.60328 type:complete len:420 (+) Transcript_36646:34-1293(+)
MNWNITSTDWTELSTSLVETTWATLWSSTSVSDDLPDEKGPPPPKEPKGPKGAEPTQHLDNIEYKEALSVIALVFVCLLIIMTLLQFTDKKFIPALRRTQFKSRAGITLFVVWCVTVLLVFFNAIMFVHFIFNIDTFDSDAYALMLILSNVPYRLSKMCMGLFFILRLYFVFNDSALRVRTWIIVVLISVLVIGGSVGLVSGFGGPLKSLPQTKDGRPTSLYYTSPWLTITIFVDVVVMLLYVAKLYQVMVMNGEIYERSSQAASRREGSKFSALQLTSTTTAGKSVTSDGERGAETNTVSTPRPENDDAAESDVEIKLSETLVNSVTKSTLLSLIGILSSFWLHIEMMVLIIKDDTDGVLLRAISAMDGAVNIICMYLVFAFSSKYYNFGCKCCHNGMRHICERWAKKSVISKSQSQP